VAVRDAKQEAELLQSKLARQAAAREAEVTSATSEVKFHRSVDVLNIIKAWTSSCWLSHSLCGVHSPCKN
jgi:hypothetical protein